MLPKKNRLTKDADFQKIRRSGLSFFSSWFRLGLMPNKRDFSRFAVVISTKVSKKATERNRLKRQLREIIHLNFDKIKSGYDVSLSTNYKALGKEYKDLENDLLRLLNKSKLLK